MGARVYAPGGLEQDRFDPFCHHLYVCDVRSGEVMSSTRILTRRGALAARCEALVRAVVDGLSVAARAGDALTVLPRRRGSAPR